MQLHGNPSLEYVLAKERYCELLASLTPKQLAVLALVLDGCDVSQAGDYLGLRFGCARERMVLARKRLLALYPDLQPGERKPIRRGDQWRETP